MSRMRTSREFASLIEELDREAQEEGPPAVAEMEALREYYRLVAELIKLRRLRKLTQRQLENETGIPQSEISRIESGHSNPTLSTLRALVRALGGEIHIVEKQEHLAASG